MSNPISPFRLLAKTHANELISREQYIEIRSQLLKKLQSQGTIDDEDLENFTQIIQGNDTPTTQRTYTSSDWLIIGLGLIASVVLAFVLFD